MSQTISDFPTERDWCGKFQPRSEGDDAKRDALFARRGITAGTKEEPIAIEITMDDIALNPSHAWWARLYRWFLRQLPWKR